MHEILCVSRTRSHECLERLEPDIRERISPVLRGGGNGNVVSLLDTTLKQAWKEIRSLYRWWMTTRPSRRDPLDDKKLVRPPLRFEKIAGTTFSRSVPPDKKKYAAYYRVLKQHARLEQKWHEEDQRNLHRLIGIREFLWT